MIDLRARLRYDWAMGDITRRRTGVRFVDWLGDGRCLEELHGPTPETVDDALADLRALDPDRHRQHLLRVIHREPRKVLVEIGASLSGADYVSYRVHRAGGYLVSPNLNEDGWETFHVLAPDRAVAADVLDVFHRFGDVELLSMRKRDDVAATRADGGLPDLVGTLSNRQRQAVRVAVAKGYYATPRRTTLEELAATMGVSRATFGEHLQKGEARLMDAMGSLLGTKSAEGLASAVAPSGDR